MTFATSFPRFLSFIFLSTAAFCLLIGAPSYGWMELEVTHNPTFGVWGYCTQSPSSGDYVCNELTTAALDELANSCSQTPPVEGLFSGSNCATRVRQWRISQSFDLLGLLAACVAAVFLLLQSLAAVGGVSFRLIRCFGSRIALLAGFLSWSALIASAIAAISSIVTSAVSHSLFDSFLTDHSPSLNGEFHWPWFASVAASTFSCVGLVFAVIFNNAKQLRSVLQPVIDPELEAYSDSSYIAVGSGADSSQFSGNSICPYTRH